MILLLLMLLLQVLVIDSHLLLLVAQVAVLLILELGLHAMLVNAFRTGFWRALIASNRVTVLHLHLEHASLFHVTTGH